METATPKIDSHRLAAEILHAMMMESLEGLERELRRFEGLAAPETRKVVSAREEEDLELLTAIAHDLRCDIPRSGRSPGATGLEVYRLLLGHLAEDEES